MAGFRPTKHASEPLSAIFVTFAFDVALVNYTSYNSSYTEFHSFSSIPQLLQHISGAVSPTSGKFPCTVMLDISSQRFTLPFSVYAPNGISGLTNLLSVKEKHESP